MSSASSILSRLKRLFDPMSADQLNQLWNLTRENEKNLAVLSKTVAAETEEIKALKEDNAAMKAILNQAIGAKTVFSIIGAAVVAVITWAITFFSTR